jgi:hypothetical protein
VKKEEESEACVGSWVVDGTWGNRQLCVVSIALSSGGSGDVDQPQKTKEHGREKLSGCRASPCRIQHVDFLQIGSDLPGRGGNYLVILRGDLPHAHDEEQTAGSGPGQKCETIGDCQREGLLPDLKAEDRPGPLGSCYQSWGVAGHACTKTEQPLIRGLLTQGHPKTQDVGVELLWLTWMHRR